MKAFLAIFSATVWISVSEFVRNEFFLKSYWIDHYNTLGVAFPDAAINGIVWGVWSLGLAILCFVLLSRFSLLQSVFISWFAAFVLMWLVVGNLHVLPFGLLIYAIPLSILECYLACLIIKTLAYKNTVPIN